MAPGGDRRGWLLAQRARNGIDFVEIVDPGQTRLCVHFLVRAPDAVALSRSIDRVAIDGPGRKEVPVVAISWRGVTSSADPNRDPEQRPLLDVYVAAPGDFSTFTLSLHEKDPTAPLLDPWFDHAEFSFKAGCPSTLDCREPPAERAAPVGTAPPIDYLAKDFEGFKKALSEFSALRYGAWQERSEADFGMMFLESLASLADDLSYQQDRVAAEAWIETATQRRSVVRLARLVDYEPRVATAARVQLELQMARPGPVPAGVGVSAMAPDGTPIEFETGTGLDDTSTYAADPAWNKLEAHWWDDSERCLSRGATSAWLQAPAVDLHEGLRLVVDTTAAVEADRPVREVVRLTRIESRVLDPMSGAQVVRVHWSAKDALQAEHDLTRTRFGANVVPATQGRRYSERFVASRQAWSARAAIPRAVTRTGANGTLQVLYTLGQAPLTWLEQDDPLEGPRPELRLTEVSRGRRWRWARSLLCPDRTPELFTLDPVALRTVDPDTGFAEYDGDEGATVRFGDGSFGGVPAPGAEFEVLYRVGGGAQGNVSADALRQVDQSHPFASAIGSVSNPLPASGGREAEPLDQVRRLAPHAFRAVTYRAVLPEDYDAAAARLPWVQRAGTSFRWTGSWLSTFTAVDPRDGEELPVDREAELAALLDRRRLAGREAHTRPPRFASLDLWVTVVARPEAFRGDVQMAVQSTLDARRHAGGGTGFFHPDRFTFGSPLERSALEAAIQEAPGVEGVVAVRYRRRGRTRGYQSMGDLVAVANDEIVRVDNDPTRPEHGSLRVEVVGGK